MLIFRSSQLRFGITLLALALTVIACSASAKDEAYFGKITPPEGQVLRYITGTEPQTLDPQTMTAQPESRIAAAIFDGLVEFEEKTSKGRPSLAKSWDVNADGTVWTFHLRTDAKWTDGAPLNAQDFVYSWRRALSPELAASNASFMYPIKNAQSYNNQSAFVRNSKTGKFATESDLKRAGANGPVNFTGAEPERFDKLPAAPSSAPNVASSSSTNDASIIQTASKPTSEKYLFVPADEEARAKLLQGDAAKKKPGNPELARFVEGKEFVPVTKEYVGVRALDDYTFEVTLESPTAYFDKLLVLQVFRPVPRQAIEKWGDALWVKEKNIVTSGAFKIQEWKPYQRIVVVRNPRFWDNANTKLDKIIFPSIESLTTAMNLYKSGEVDAMQSNEVPTSWRNQLKATKKDYVGGPYLQIQYLAFKTTMPPVNDARVRRAMSLAINRQIIADQAPGRAPLTGFTAPMEGYEGYKGEGYNPDEARRLLAEAGFPGGRGFPEIEILYNTNESNKQTMEFVQSMLKRELGIKVELTNQEAKVWVENTRNNRMNFKGLARRGWSADYVDPNAFLELMTSAAANNGTLWADPKYDGMLRTANAMTDNAARMKMLAEAEAYLMKQQPVIPLYVGVSAFMLKPYVKNLLPNPLDQHDWRNVYIDHNWQSGEESGQQQPSALRSAKTWGAPAFAPLLQFFRRNVLSST